MTPPAYEWARGLSMVAFGIYGVHCLASERMAAEFERYGLARFRHLTGWLEVIGALGLAVGYLYPASVAVASGGLCLLMLLGVATRIRIRDPLVACFPAGVLMLVNAYVFALSYRELVA